MKNKIIIIILAVLSISFIGCGIYGYTLHKSNNIKSNTKIPESKNEITYKYFIEDVESETLPQNTEEYEYLFSKYNCTNNITGTFDMENWKFNISSGSNGECNLYFVKSKYEVTLTITNGVADEENLKYIEREKDGEFKIIPNDGYKYKEATCANSKTGSWDSSTNTFKLTAITSDTACKIVFEKKDLKIDVYVNNGKGATSEKVYYGDSKSIIVEPSDGYGNPTIVCTNDQIATFENNSINFEKVLNDTQCTVTFSKNETVKYTLKINIPEELSNKITIEQGDTSVQITKGQTGSVTLRSSDATLDPTLSCKNDAGNSIVPTISGDTSKKFEFLDVISNITCTVGTTNK